MYEGAYTEHWTENQANILFSVKRVHYIGREGLHLPLNGYGDTNLVQEGMILGQRCPQLRTLILDMDSHLGFKGGMMQRFLRALLTLGQF